MTERIVKRYSIAFKKHVVGEYEKGESLYALQARYGIGGSHTIARWVKQYGREGLRHKVMRIQQPEEQDRVKELEGRVKELEAALVQATLDRLMYQAMVEVAEEKYGLELKKTNVARSSTEPTPQARKRGSR